MSDFNTVLADFKRHESPEDIIPILTDENARRLIIAWPKILIKRKKTRKPVPAIDNEKWAWLWEQVEWNEEELQEVSAIPEIKTKRIFNQLRGNRLIYPDGSVAVYAGKYLKGLVGATIKELKRRYDAD